VASLPRDVRDPKDLPVLAGAIACGADFLLSFDEKIFPHGGSFGNIDYWNPDTFLMRFFSNEPAAYERVGLMISHAFKAGLLPRRA
jgi:predicted nucleic acid-binding protein